MSAGTRENNWDKVTNEVEDELFMHYVLDEFEEGSDNGIEAKDEDEILDTVEDIHEKAGPTPLPLEKEADDEVIEEPETKKTILAARQTSKVPRYRIPLSEDEAQQHEESGGLLWHIKIFKDGYSNKRFTTPEGILKPRRVIPHVFASDFFSSLTKTEDGRYIFTGKLNGWPALNNLELLNLEFWYTKKVGKKSATYTKRYWKKTENGKKAPGYPKAGSGFFINAPKCVRATLQMPAWSEVGYSKDNTGLCFYYAQFRQGGARMAHGINMIKAIRDDAERTGSPIPRAVMAHYFGHRYVKKKESLKDKITYHTGVLIEWDHGKYTTVIELAYLRGLGGYAGNSNWCDDSYGGTRTKMYDAMPDWMKAPWDTHRSEIRIIDHVSKNVDEFRQYMKKYEGVRFNNPEIRNSAPVRISYNSVADLAQYCNNYSVRDTSYAESGRNCQTFAVDFWSFLTGKIRDAEPYYPVKVVYKEKRHMFLYEPMMFDKKGKQGVRARIKKIID